MSYLWMPIAHWKTSVQTLTVSPQTGSGGSNVTCDGRIARTGVSETFATIRSGSGTANNETDTGIGVYLYAATTSNQYQGLHRAGLTFDTSSIPSGAEITQVTLRLRGYDKLNSLGSTSLVVCAFTPATNNNFANTDFALSNWGSEYARVSYASWSTTGYNAIDLPASAVTKAGITRIGLRLGWDFDNSTSGLTWASGVVTGFYFRAADNGTDIPELVITYIF